MDRRPYHHTTAQLSCTRRVASLGLPTVAGNLALQPLADRYYPATLPRLFYSAAGSVIFIAWMSVMEARVERVGRVGSRPQTDD